MTEPCEAVNERWFVEISRDVDDSMSWRFKFRFDHKPDVAEFYQCWCDLSRYTGYEIQLGDGIEYGVRLYRENDDGQEVIQYG